LHAAIAQLIVSGSLIAHRAATDLEFSKEEKKNTVSVSRSGKCDGICLDRRGEIEAFGWQRATAPAYECQLL